jgi:tRNA-dihydrouridine synthase
MEQLLRAVRRAVQLPVTLKYRAGWDEGSLNYLDTARMAEAVGIAALALHPRTRAQGYSGSADWQRVAAVKQVVRIPVVGSGDVRTAADALERLRTSGADGVMIGRAAMANPWIFLQADQLRRGMTPFIPGPAERLEWLQRYVALCRESLGDRLALNKLKQIIGQYAIELPGSAALREAIHRATAIDVALELLERFFAPHLDGVTQY